MEYVYETSHFTSIKGLRQQDAVSCGLHALMNVTLIVFGVQPVHLNNPEWDEEDIDETLWEWFHALSKTCPPASLRFVPHHQITACLMEE